MASIRNMVSAVITGGAVYLFLTLWMHAPQLFCVAAGSVLGVLVLVVTGSAPSPRSRAADRAWLEAAPDLPPAADRARLEALRFDPMARPAARTATAARRDDRETRPTRPPRGDAG